MRAVLVCVLLSVSGCGLLLDADLDDVDGSPDGSTTDGGRLDADPMDSQRPDSTSLDSAPPDTMMRMDGMSGDVMRVDADPSAPPTIASGMVEVGSVPINAPAGVDYLRPVPFRVDTVKFVSSEPMDEPTFLAVLYGSTGPVPVAITKRSMPGGTTIQLSPLDPLGLANGWYCVHIPSSAATSGRMLDGEWIADFPSGDGVEGGEFLYGFAILAGDVDGDGEVTMGDVNSISDAFGGTDPRYDLNGDGVVNILDLSLASSSLSYRVDSYEVPTQCRSAIPAP